MVISALHLSMKIKKLSLILGHSLYFFVFCVLSFVSLLHCCFVICIVTFFFPLPSHIFVVFSCFLLVASCKLWCCSCLLSHHSSSIHHIIIHVHFMSRYTFTFAHLILLLLYFVVFLKFSSCYVLSCHVLFLFVSLHPYSFFLCSCFYKIIINDIMCPFCIGCQLTSIKYGSFILQVKH
jgi:hypothetical protein